MKIAIVGDSFSSDAGPESWVSLLRSEHEVVNFSCRGISEYRIFKIIQQNLPSLTASDAVVIFHTHSDRVYVPDHVSYPTRSLASHPCADMIASDVSSRAEWSTIAKTYYKYFFDFDFQHDLTELIVKDIAKMLSNKPVIHCTGHDQNLQHVDCKSFHEIHCANPGTCNHMNEQGNRRVFDYINQKLKCITIPC